MSPAGFEPTTPAREQPQTRALDRAATQIGIHVLLLLVLQSSVFLKIAQSRPR
jgi:hypothetical protein